MEAPCKEGDRIRLIEMPDDPCPIPKDSEGTVDRVQELWDKQVQIGVKWDSGRTLSLIHPKDKFSIIPPKKIKVCSHHAKFHDAEEITIVEDGGECEACQHNMEKNHSPTGD